VPIFFVFLMRPERDVPGWKLVNAIKDRFGEGLTEINLSPLSETHSELLLTNLLDIQTLPENLRNLILNKAEGNPFFLEEVIRMLIDREILTYQGDEWSVQKQIDHVDIPDNLQGLLLARIDRLPEEVKRTLRVAAVIGRQFSVRILEQVLEKQSQG
jgi:predicted ATPase